MADVSALAAAGTRPGRRLWHLPLRAHLAALAVLLLALVPVIGTGSSFSADEGAAIVQARSLARGDGWLVEHPVPEADPTGASYPLELSDRGSKGTAPFAKHPLYALLLAGADRMAGVTGMVLLSLFGTLAAGGFAAALATRLDPVLGRPALWAVGLGSPLLLDGYLVIAHTLGAAACAAAVLCAVTALDRRSVVLGAAVCPCVAIAVLLRSEASLLGLALAAASAAMALRRPPAWPALLVAVAAGGAALSARVVERVWLESIVGRSGAVVATALQTPGGGLRGRIDGFVLTWLTPNYTGAPLHALLLVLMVGSVLMAAVSARLHPQRGRPVALAALVAGAAATGALLAGPRTVVPGLLMAFPLVAAGLVVLGRRNLHSTDARLATGTVVLFVLGVAATQYSTGGSGEWGGRYFALAIPVGVPALLLALHCQGDLLSPRIARRALAALVVCSVALSLMAVGSIRHTHRVTGELVSAVERATPRGGVVVTTYPAMPRLAWSIFESRRWLLTTSSDLEALVDRLAENGIREFTFVTRDLPLDRTQLAGMRVVSSSGRADGQGLQVLALDGR